MCDYPVLYRLPKADELLVCIRAGYLTGEGYRREESEGGRDSERYNS